MPSPPRRLRALSLATPDSSAWRFGAARSGLLEVGACQIRPALTAHALGLEEDDDGGSGGSKEIAVAAQGIYDGNWSDNSELFICNVDGEIADGAEN
uniref:Uncharacterized protein n=1 Tax=Oryza barthii TaxID=65489 RepID=A0A0D3F2Y8_9ORYZ